MEAVGTLTPGYLVNLVLDEEIDHRDNRGKESKLSRERLAVRCEMS